MGVVSETMVSKSVFDRDGSGRESSGKSCWPGMIYNCIEIYVRVKAQIVHAIECSTCVH